MKKRLKSAQKSSKYTEKAGLPDGKPRFAVTKIRHSTDKNKLC